MKTLIYLVTCGILAATVAQAETYSCRDDRGGPVSLALTFEGKKLVQAVARNITYKKFPQTLTMKAAQLRKSTGQNSEEKFAHYDFDLSKYKGEIDRFYQSGQVSFGFSYPYQKKGRALTLDQSLVETYETVDGAPYGKLRMDLEFDGGFDTYGSTWTFFCKRTR